MRTVSVDDDQPDLVDVFYQPYLRALGNLVITFANAEAALLNMVSEFLGEDEIAAVTLLKAPDARDQVLRLLHEARFPGCDLDDLRNNVKT